MNRAYIALGGVNNEALQLAQRDWIQFRDSQQDYLKQVFSNQEGTMWILRYGVILTDSLKSKWSACKLSTNNNS
ncbi:lysozyme inhibitor LprI family protein [Vibrio superstes]|uniref:lysozyme inhibitor LprI family protein n=1 Tax=Vibrio superstes TaxID=198815 RepID=UPI000E5B208C